MSSSNVETLRNKTQGNLNDSTGTFVAIKKKTHLATGNITVCLRTGVSKNTETKLSYKVALYIAKK